MEQEFQTGADWEAARLAVPSGCSSASIPDSVHYQEYTTTAWNKLSAALCRCKSLLNQELNELGVMENRSGWVSTRHRIFDFQCLHPDIHESIKDFAHSVIFPLSFHGKFPLGCRAKPASGGRFPSLLTKCSFWDAACLRLSFSIEDVFQEY